jgi:hypothetical protein
VCTCRGVVCDGRSGGGGGGGGGGVQSMSGEGRGGVGLLLCGNGVVANIASRLLTLLIVEVG